MMTPHVYEPTDPSIPNPIGPWPCVCGRGPNHDLHVPRSVTYASRPCLAPAGGEGDGVCQLPEGHQFEHQDHDHDPTPGGVLVWDTPRSVSTEVVELARRTGRSVADVEDEMAARSLGARSDVEDEEVRRRWSAVVALGYLLAEPTAAEVIRDIGRQFAEAINNARGEV